MRNTYPVSVSPIDVRLAGKRSKTEAEADGTPKSGFCSSPRGELNGVARQRSRALKTEERAAEVFEGRGFPLLFRSAGSKWGQGIPVLDVSTGGGSFGPARGAVGGRRMAADEISVSV